MSDVGELIISAVRDVANHNPATVYEKPVDKCVYIYKGYPSCLLGYVLYNLGFIDASWDNTDGNTVGIEFALEFLDLEVDYEELEWLEYVQSVQDGGMAWGQAIKRADGECALTDSRAAN